MSFIAGFLLFSLIASSQSMVCFQGICDNIQKPVEHCKGTTIKNGGFCGCYDVCAKQEGDECDAEAVRDRLPLGKCDVGLTCQAQSNMMFGSGKCVKNTKQAARETHTVCQQRRMQSMISMVVYRGQWFPKCDEEGLFMPEQCDNTGMCFCVDIHSGAVHQETKVQGSANCMPTTVAP
ncbi:uncharacterized protein LOC127867309 [Dreissena polymorpha]|uniref:Thyroglobulin type-1 domain-containing protein n=1 Tax=Dreissena polymorpha TaxID=45954 RepID=A0A9D4NCI6_DREPO|nr:uncharacterized protein LOC127867309 [Dreissena polymorpha]KAH3890757.1 hypothetical protein DPMN_014845 [Dreissena polymorpha]